MKVNVAETFNKIYKEEGDAIFRFCVIRVSSREQALDITQETFLRFWQSLMAKKEIYNKRAFLYTVAHRLIIDWYRKKKSLSLDAMLGDRKDAVYDDFINTKEENHELKAEGRFLLEKLSELSPNHQHPVYLRFVEGLSPGEIGEILGISPNAASVRVNRGILELRKKTGYNKKNGT